MSVGPVSSFQTNDYSKITTIVNETVQHFDELENEFCALVNDSEKRPSFPAMNAASQKFSALKREFLHELDKLSWQFCSPETLQRRANEMSRELTTIISNALTIDRRHREDSMVLASRLERHVQQILETKSPTLKIEMPAPKTFRNVGLISGSAALGGAVGYLAEGAVDQTKVHRASNQAIDAYCETANFKRAETVAAKVLKAAKAAAHPTFESTRKAAEVLASAENLHQKAKILTKEAISRAVEMDKIAENAAKLAKTNPRKGGLAIGLAAGAMVGGAVVQALGSDP